MAIERYAVMAADAAAAPGKISIYDAQFKENATIDISAPVTKGQPKWSNYIRGVLAGFQNRGEKIPALDVALHFHRAAGRRLEQQRRARSLHRDVD